MKEFLLIFGGLLALACAYIYSQGGSPFALAHISPLQGDSVVGSPTITAQNIDQILCSNGSPACDTGQEMYALGVQYGIDPIYALAFFQHESGFGLRGEATITRNMGNLRSASNESFERDGFAVFNSWPDSYRAWYDLISGPLYVKGGLRTVQSIVARYAPSGDGNDPNGYAQSVEQSVSQWRQNG